MAHDAVWADVVGAGLMGMTCNADARPHREFIWSFNNVPSWAVVIGAVIFFLGVTPWMLGVLQHFSKKHTWCLPIFSLGLLCPRWCQVREVVGVGITPRPNAFH